MQKHDASFRAAAQRIGWRKGDWDVRDSLDPLLQLPEPSYAETYHTIQGLRFKANRIASVAYEGYGKAVKLQETERAFDLALQRAAAAAGVTPLHRQRHAAPALAPPTCLTNPCWFADLELNVLPF